MIIDLRGDDALAGSIMKEYEEGCEGAYIFIYYYYSVSFVHRGRLEVITNCLLFSYVSRSCC